MAQEIKPEAAAQPMPEGYVKPQDPVTVYATALDVFHLEGEGYEVHKALATKLIASGKATKPLP